jgi:hypothetical protein
MKKRDYTSIQIAIKAKQSKFLRTKQLKVPKTSQTTSVYNSKLNQNEIEVNSQHNQLNVQCTRLKACEPSNLQNKQVSHDNQSSSINLY